MSLDGLFKVLFLAVVQGIAEFLPISSSGHLVVLDTLHQRFFGGGAEQENILLNVVLHVGRWGRFWSSIARIYGSCGASPGSVWRCAGDGPGGPRRLHAEKIR